MNKGFIALTLVLSVTTTLLALVAASSLDSALFFDMALRKEYRTMNHYYAGNCIDQAILRIAHDHFYLVSVPKEIPYLNCSILSITKEGDLRHISTRGDFQEAYVYRSAVIRVHIHDLEVVKIE